MIVEEYFYHILEAKNSHSLLRERVGGHDAQLNQIYDAIENLLDEKVEQKKRENRERIGFKK